MKQAPMKTAVRAAATNRLLAGLPDLDQHRLLSRSSFIELGTADVLYEPGKRIRAVYFPTGGSVALITTLRGHDRLEVGLVGDEGMLGTSLVLGVTIAPSFALVQDSGAAWRIDAVPFSEELERSVALRVRLQRYVHVVMCQSAQTVACTRFHVVEARLARWLLMTRDRAHSDQFPFDARVARIHPRGASRGSDACRGLAAAAAADPLQPGPDHDHGPSRTREVRLCLLRRQPGYLRARHELKCVQAASGAIGLSATAYRCEAIAVS